MRVNRILVGELAALREEVVVAEAQRRPAKDRPHVKNLLKRPMHVHGGLADGQSTLLRLERELVLA